MSSTKESIDESLKKIFTQYVQQLDKKVARVRWSEEQIRNEFAKRNVEEIRENGTTHYANPCLDLSLMTYFDLSKINATPFLLIQTHKNNNSYSKGELGMHFVIPFKRQGEKYFLEFRSENEVVLGNKEYENTRKDVEVLDIKLIDHPLDPKKNLFENLNLPLEKIGFDFDSYLDTLVRTSLAPGEFEGFQKRMEKTPSLYLVTDF